MAERGRRGIGWAMAALLALALALPGMHQLLEHADAADHGAVIDEPCAICHVLVTAGGDGPPAPPQPGLRVAVPSPPVMAVAPPISPDPSAPDIRQSSPRGPPAA